MEAAATANKNNTANIKAKWSGFQSNLAGVLQQLTDGQYLIIAKQQTNLFVQVVQQGTCVRVETISNHFRDADAQLTKAQIAKLVKLGWQLPTRPDSTPENDFYGSPNFFVDVFQPVDSESLAAMMILTLIQIIGVTDPADLEYEARDAEGNAVALPELGLVSGVGQ
jgi:hypothetical protein